MTTPKPGPIRSVRVPDDLWNAAKARAASEGTTISELIRHWIRNYVNTPPKEKR